MKRFIKRQEVGRLAEMLLSEAETDSSLKVSIDFERDYENTFYVKVYTKKGEGEFRLISFELSPEEIDAREAVREILDGEDE